MKKEGIILFTSVIIFSVLFLSGCSSSETPDGIAKTVAEKAEQKVLEKIMPKDAAEFLIYMQKSLTEPQGKVVYEADESQLITAFYKKDGKIRTENFINGLENRAYAMDGKIYQCTKLASGWACIEMNDPRTALVETDYESDIEVTESDVNDTSKTDIKKDGTMQIAGTTATCFKISDLESKEEMRYCFADNGFILYSSITTKEDVIEMKAKEYSAKADDSDFVLPATPKVGTIDENLAFLERVQNDPNYKDPFGSDAGEVLEETVPSSGDYSYESSGEIPSCASYCEGLEGQELADCIAAC